MYTNKPSHRYHARKDYFIEEEKKALAQKMEEKTNNNKENGKKQPRVTLGYLARLAIVPRVKAIINPKEGNIAVLNAGLHDVEEATAERKLQMAQKRHKIINSMTRIASYEKEIEDLNNLLKITKDPTEIEKIEKVIEQRKAWKSKLEGILIETERTEIDSVSTDPLSVSQHDKANKANITASVMGFKTAAKAATGLFISKYLYEEVLRKIKLPDTYKWIPGQEIEKEIVETIEKIVPGMDEYDISKITLGDIYDKGSGLLTYDAFGGNKIQDKTSFFRGLAFKYNGKLLSGSDGNGFDPTVLTNVKLDQPIDSNTPLVSIIEEILEDTTGKDFKPSEIAKLIADGQISGFDIWRSTSEQGIPMGWFDASEIVPDIMNTGSHIVTEEITKTVIETIPGRWEIIPGKEYFEKVLEINPVVVAAEAALAGSIISDLNDEFKFTRSQRDLQMGSTKKLINMAKENEEEEKQEEQKNGKDKKKFSIRGTRRKDAPKLKTRGKIKSYQRTNKSLKRRYTYGGDEMRNATKREAEKREGTTVFEKFVGSKKDDFRSGYDENAIGTNDKLEIPEIEEGERE